jgi:hypothetical protein
VSLAVRCGALLLLAACAAPADSTSTAASPAPPPGATPTAADLAWLAGRWVMATPDGRVEEAWLPPDGGTLYGVGRTVSGGATRFFEFLAIEPRGSGPGATLAYVARPRGAAPTEFLLVQWDKDRFVFVNAGHDFPKRIVYERRAPDRLHARVDDGTDEGEGEDYEYRREG